MRTLVIGALCAVSLEAEALRLGIERDTVHWQTDAINGAVVVFGSESLQGLQTREWRMIQAAPIRGMETVYVPLGAAKSSEFINALWIDDDNLIRVAPQATLVRPTLDCLPIQGLTNRWKISLRSPLLAELGPSTISGLLSAQATPLGTNGLRVQIEKPDPVLKDGEASLDVNVVDAAGRASGGSVSVSLTGLAGTVTQVQFETQPPLWAYFSSKSRQLWVRSHFSAEQDVVLCAEVSTTGNQLLNQSGAYLVPRTNGYSTSQLLRGGISVLSGSDTTAPIGTDECGLISGNHGYVSYLLEGVDSVQTPVGSTWVKSNGDRFMVESTGANGTILAPVPTADKVNWHCGNISTSTVLTSSGGEPTMQLVFTNVTATQLWPVVKELQIELAADGAELAADIGVFCANLTVRMSWDLVDPSTVDFTRVPLDLTAGEAWAHFEHRWEYSDFGNVTIYQTNSIVRPMRLSRLGAIQCLPLYRYSSQLDRWLYIPGTTPYLGSDLSEGVPFNSVPTNLNVRGNLYVDTNNTANLGDPPSRVIEVLRDASGHTPVAYTFGYLPEEDAAASRRLDRCGMFIRFNAGSLKGYPSLIEGSIGTVWNTNFTATCFTQVYDPQLSSSSATSVAWQRMMNGHRVEADFITSPDEVLLRLPNYLVGVPYVIESKSESIQLEPGRPGPIGLNLQVIGGKGSCVLRFEE